MMLLDEPTAGMTHEDVERIAALIKRVAANRTVLMVEHNLSVVVDAVRPHHRAGARRDPRRGRLRGGVEESRGGRGLPGSRPCLRPRGRSAGSRRDGRRAAARGARPARLVRRVAHPARRRLRRARRRGGDAARPQRRRQDDDAEVDHGHRAAPRRLDRASRAREMIAPAVEPHRARSASPTARRSAASSPASTSRRTCCCRRWCATAGCRSSRSTSCSRTCGSGARARAPSSRAASSRCWRSAASCAPARGCCCSTSRPRAWRR